MTEIEQLRSALKDALEAVCDDHCAVGDNSVLEDHDKICREWRILTRDPIARCPKCANGTCKAHGR